MRTKQSPEVYARELAELNSREESALSNRRSSNRQKFSPTKSREYVLKQGMAPANSIILRDTINPSDSSRQPTPVERRAPTPDVVKIIGNNKVIASVVQPQPPIVDHADL